MSTTLKHASIFCFSVGPGFPLNLHRSIFDPTRVLLWKQWYPEMAVKGAEKVGDRDVYVLETHPGKPETERLFIDQQTGLLIRDEVMPRVVFAFSDYRAVDGVRMAFTESSIDALVFRRIERLIWLHVFIPLTVTIGIEHQCRPSL